MHTLYSLSSGSEKPEISELHRHIVPQICSKVEYIPEHHLNTIAVNNTNHPSYCEQCCKAMLQKWMKITPNATCEYVTYGY